MTLPITIIHLLEYRKLNNYTQAQAAESVGVTRPAWSHWEAGRRKIPAYVGKIISKTEQ